MRAVMALVLVAVIGLGIGCSYKNPVPPGQYKKMDGNPGNSK